MSKDDDAETPEKLPVRRGLMANEIFEHATRLFAERGYSGTSFQDIADAVGLTRPALYHYVKSKEQLLGKLVAEVTVVAAKDIARVARKTDRSATARVSDIVQLLVRGQGEKGELFRLLLRSEADLPDSVAASYADNRRAVLRSMTTVIEQGVERGEFRPVNATVAAFGTLGIINWVAWWYHPGSFKLDDICAELADLAVHSLAAEPGRLSSRSPRDAVRALRREVDRLDDLLKDTEPR